MLFKDINTGYTVHLFDKQNISYYKGTVTEKIGPRPSTPEESLQMGGQPGMLVDITVDYNGLRKQFCVSPETMVARGANEVLAIDEDIIVAEIEATRRTSEDALFAVERHKDIIAKCGDALASVSPRYKQEAEQEERLGRIEKQMENMMDLLAKLANTNNPLNV